MMFPIRKGVPLPVTQPNVNRLPFPWEGMTPGDSFFVPHDFWKDRVEDGTKVDFKLAKDRIKGSFTTWKKAKEADRKHLVLVITEEKQKVDDTIPDEQAAWVTGAGVFLTTTLGDIKPAEPEAQPEAQPAAEPEATAKRTRKAA